MYTQGDLGAIDEQYDVAISTACGALDHIVVDTMDTAVKCVEFLKKNNVGTATFIGLDKVSCGAKRRVGRPGHGLCEIIFEISCIRARYRLEL